MARTTLDFTGQRKDDTGLLFYNARYYDPKVGRFISADSIVPGIASGTGGGAATLGQDDQAALRPLTVDFHEPNFAVGLAQEHAFTQAKGFWFQLSHQDRQQGEGAKWQWGPLNPQALNRYSYVLNNPLRYTDPTGHFIPVAVAALFTAEVLADVVALFVVVTFVTAVISCSQDAGCSSVLGRFADQLNNGAITVQEFLNSVQRSLAKSQSNRRYAGDPRSARQVIGAEKQGKILREFPGEWLDKTPDEIYAAAAAGNRSAKTAKKLLDDARFDK